MQLEEKIRTAIRNVPDFPKPGINFKDVTPLFLNQQLCTEITEGFINKMQQKPDAIVGIESRGFLFGFLMANKLGIPFVLIRKAGKLPYKKLSVAYELEYGVSEIEMHEDALQKGWKVMVHDDLLATGGTAEAAAVMIQKAGAELAGFNFVVGLDYLKGKEKLVKYTNSIVCLVSY